MINSTQDFINAMTADVSTLYTRIQLLDSNEDVINQIDTSVIEGSIDIDRDRDARRQMKLTIDNTDGSFSWSPGGMVWIDKRIKVFAGLQIPVSYNTQTSDLRSGTLVNLEVV